jgi:hypothetical protein
MPKLISHCSQKGPQSDRFGLSCWVLYLIWRTENAQGHLVEEFVLNELPRLLTSLPNPKVPV